MSHNAYVTTGTTGRGSIALITEYVFSACFTLHKLNLPFSKQYKHHHYYVHLKAEFPTEKLAKLNVSTHSPFPLGHQANVSLVRLFRNNQDKQCVCSKTKHTMSNTSHSKITLKIHIVRLEKWLIC